MSSIQLKHLCENFSEEPKNPHDEVDTRHRNDVLRTTVVAEVEKKLPQWKFFAQEKNLNTSAI